MKPLFLVIVLANLMVLLWEYRSGALVDPQIVTADGQEQIILVGEEKNAAGEKE
jgi:hypothetical protein